jgi:nicotinate phosphoribosyltransferase
LFKPVVLDGEVVPGSLPPLSEIWEFAQGNLRRLPDEYRQPVSPKPYPVRVSEGICRMRDEAVAEQQRSTEEVHA